jgi:hypothetical protein
LAVGKGQLAKGSWQRAVGKGQLAKGSWQRAVGKGQLAIRRVYNLTDIIVLFIFTNGELFDNWQ